MPLGQLAVGCVAAILITKQLFGGIGMNFANPALVGRIVLFISFASEMNAWVYPDAAVDQLASATPLQVADPSRLNLFDLFMGIHGGVLGETCALAILLGFVYLVVTRTISPAIPLSYVGSMFLFYLIATQSLHESLVEVLSGGLLFGAVFMATDYVTSPFTLKGKLFYGVCLGLVTFAIRYWGSYTEGVSFALLFMNLWVPFINDATRQTPYGYVKVADPSRLNLFDLFMGIHGGVLGETCALAILLGFVYLVVTRTISPAIPLSYVGSMFLFYLIATQSLHESLVEVLSGGLLFGAVFMATDYVTSPFTLKGKLFYGVCLGLVTFAIRYWGSYTEGVSFALLFMNLWVPFINDATRQTPYGYVKPAKKAGKEGASK